MPKLITASSLMLFWAFYEMSGGADFAPNERVIASELTLPVSEDVQIADVSRPDTPVVTNAAYAAAKAQALPEIADVAPETVEAVVTEIAPVQIDEPTFDMVYVSGTRVNLREGPGTNHSVLDTLTQGTAAELIGTNDNGWAQIRLVDADITGWMAERLLSDG